MLTVKEDDTHEVFFLLTDQETGSPIDLTDTTVTMIANSRAGVSVAMTVTVSGPPTDGRLVHRLTGLLDPGMYVAVIKMVKTGVLVTAPTEDMLRIKVVPTLP